MLGSFLWPDRNRNDADGPQEQRQSWINRHTTPVLLSVSHRAAVHPIFTILGSAILASTTYLGLYQSGLFKRQSGSNVTGLVDVQSLLLGSKSLHASQDTNWKWSIEDDYGGADEHFALITLVFPDSHSASPQTAPKPHNVPVPANSSAKILPCSQNLLSPISYDSTIAISVPFSQASMFLTATQEIPVSQEASQTRYAKDGTSREDKKWIMKAVKNTASSGLVHWTQDAWSALLDLLKNAETLDIMIMMLGYIAMHLTFVSLYLSMKRLGSRIWLATMVLFSSCFAFLLGLIVTIRMGVPLNVVLLSEGLPFLVVTVGFEKPIILTRAILAASMERQKMESQNAHARTSKQQKLPTVQYALQKAIKERGFEILCDYFVEIVVLVAGAASPVQGGLRPFCFLAAWILIFDCLFLFTFYVSVLTVKLEINRIKRHVALRNALTDDGVSRKVADKVASSNDGPKDLASEDNPFFSGKVRSSSVHKFKAVMLTAFFLINVINLCTIPFSSRTLPFFSGLSNVMMQTPLDPYKVAGSGLDVILDAAKQHGRSTLVTVLKPIKYELEYPSVHYSPYTNSGLFGGDNAAQIYNGMGGGMFDSLLRSFEDPFLSKWIVVALVISLVFNGYLFNAARLTIKEPQQPDQPPKDSEVMDDLATPITPSHRETPLTNGHVLPSDPQAGEVDVLDERLIAEQVAPTLGRKRSKEECEAILKEKRAHKLTDEELIELSIRGKIPGYALEKTLGDMTRAVKIRRSVVSRTHATRETSTLVETSKLPYKHYDYERVHGACCENVIGYMPLPVGVAGPIMIDGQNYFLPMATTEGVLVASTSRGCKAINAGGGAITVLTGDGMTRGPCVGFATVSRAGAAKVWLDSEDGQRTMRTAFNSTSRFARLQQMKTALAGTYLYIRFKTTTGDAMGMNMISKGVEHALHVMSTEAGFDDMAIISVSGNFCTDKKPAAINWVDGRGKSVVAEAIIPGDVVRTVLKSSVDALCELNQAKNLIGSAMAGSIGGFNAHAANIVTALFLATGQDPAQNVESSNCITVMKNLHGALQISVSMPSIEVGTIGGGTVLEPQAAMLDLLGVRGPHPTSPGDNARQLARVVAAAVLAGELSLCSALAAGHLVRAHMSHNRSAVASAVPSRAPTPAPEKQADVSVNGSSSAGLGVSLSGQSPRPNGVAAIQRTPSGVQTPTSLAMTEMRAKSGAAGN